MAKPIKIEIVGDSSGFKKAIGEATSSMGKLTQSAQRVGKGVAAGLAIATTAAVAVGVKSVASAVGFEKSMNEVFTLLPDISGDAMDEMNKQVLNFSKEFGTLPDEVVPALYSALSAGVPKDNVFAFMETANQLAVGGVTDVETAVDGLSSVVNAYGDDIITAAQASDIMFTTVKLGKTTVDEISRSISNVTPLASALGVGFDEVGAGLAVLTSKGVPTAQATTQLRAAFSELSKEGSIADKAFRDLAGVSFTDFLANGGDLITGLQIMDQGAQDAGGSVIDMFGSVEAGSAVLGLTAGDADAFNGAMDEMDESAGATETAFETMASGMSFQFDRIKAAVSVFMIQVGTKLMPVVKKLADFFLEKLVPAIGKFVTKIKKDVIPVIKELWKKYLEPLRKKVLDKLTEAWNKLTKNGEDLVPVFAAIGAIVGLLTIAFLAWAASMVIAAAPVLLVVAAVAALTAAIVWAWRNVDWFREAVQGMVKWFMKSALPQLKKWGKLFKELFDAAFDAVMAIVKTFVKIVKKIWDGWGKDLVSGLKKAFDGIMQMTRGALKILTGIFDLIKAVLTGKWGEAWKAIKKIMSGAVDQIMGLLKTLPALAGIALSLMRTAIAAVFTTAWNAAKTAVSDGWDKVATFFREIPGKISAMAWRFLAVGKELGSSIMTGIGNALSGAASLAASIGTKMRNAVKGALNWMIRKINGLDFHLGWPINKTIGFPDIPLARAMGGPASGNVLVGERGPEVVNLPQGSNVVANHEAGGTAGGITVNVQTDADPHKIASEVAWAIRMGGR